MSFFRELVSNLPLLSALLGWAIAQLIKGILYGVMNRGLSFERFFGSGGMPSSHAATMCAFTTATAFRFGAGSFEFAAAFLLMVVVLYDARGVRLETGKQAVAIHTIVEYLKKTASEPNKAERQLSLDQTLKELVGHTPLQVLAGGILGILIGIAVH